VACVGVSGHLKVINFIFKLMEQRDYKAAGDHTRASCVFMTTQFFAKLFSQTGVG
jgi:hypothetical protein